MRLPGVWLLLLVECAVLAASAVADAYDHCIIGAGAGGVQLAFFLQQSNRSYIVLERSQQAASFFAAYPRHRSLISINKKSTPRHGQHPDFRLRHDWNSLLSTRTDVSSANTLAHSFAYEHPELLFGHFSDEFYPEADAVVEYVNHFVSHFNLNVRYETDVHRVMRMVEEDASDPSGHTVPPRFKLLTRNATFSTVPEAEEGAEKQKQNGELLCGNVVVATGLAASFSPTNMRKRDVEGEPLVYGYEDVPLNRDFYRNKDVLILGKGNAAFELANNISAVASSTSIVSRSSLRLSYMTHYPGDVRAVNTRLIDQYQLKSLDTIIDMSDKDVDFGDEASGLHFSRAGDGRVRLQITPSRFRINVTELDQQLTERGADGVPCERGRRCLLVDVVVRCLGWRFDVSPFANVDDGHSHRVLPQSMRAPGDSGLVPHTTDLGTLADVDPTCPQGHVTVAPRLNGRNRKYPDSTSWFESPNEPGLHFAGTLMHVHDFRKAAGGFIHGYRYLVRTLYRHLERVHYAQPWPVKSLGGGNGEWGQCSLLHLLNHTLDRINSASGLYQMFSILSDVIVLDRSTGACMYIEEVPMATLVGDRIGKSDGGIDVHALALLEETLNQQPSVETRPEPQQQFEFLTVFFTYGDHYQGCKVLTPEHRKGRFNDFLHPRLYHYQQSRQSFISASSSPDNELFEPVGKHEVPEDLDTNWRDPERHVRPLARFLGLVLSDHGKD